MNSMSLSKHFNFPKNRESKDENGVRGKDGDQGMSKEVDLLRAGKEILGPNEDDWKRDYAHEMNPPLAIQGTSNQSQSNSNPNSRQSDSFLEISFLDSLNSAPEISRNLSSIRSNLLEVPSSNLTVSNELYTPSREKPFNHQGSTSSTPNQRIKLDELENDSSAYRQKEQENLSLRRVGLLEELGMGSEGVKEGEVEKTEVTDLSDQKIPSVGVEGKPVKDRSFWGSRKSKGKEKEKAVSSKKG